MADVLVNIRAMVNSMQSTNTTQKEIESQCYSFFKIILVITLICSDHEFQTYSWNYCHRKQ